MRQQEPAAFIDTPFDLPDPLAPDEEPGDPSDLDDGHLSVDDDAQWEVFIPDDDQRDPVPEPGDFWGSDERGAVSGAYD